MPYTVPAPKLKRIARLLLENRQNPPPRFWRWLSDLSGKPADKVSANKFLLACILDYQIRAETAWDNAARLAEQILGDPDDLWGAITQFPESAWTSKWSTYGLHRFPAAHKRVWRIGREVVNRYGGDARRIWTRQTPSVALNRLGEMQVGPQISRMVVGALIDTGQISGSGDVKADSNVTRVLGRVFEGTPLSNEEATRMAREMHGPNPWLLDRPLYLLGKEVCKNPVPYCDACYLRTECFFYQDTRK